MALVEPFSRAIASMHPIIGLIIDWQHCTLGGNDGINLIMRILSEADSELYAKLVRLAGGDTGIVMSALSKPGRRSIRLGVLVDEIVAARRAKREQSGASSRLNRDLVKP